MGKCFALNDMGLCVAVSSTGIKQIGKKCGSIHCPFYKPEGQEDKVKRIGGIEPYNKTQLQKVLAMPGIGEYAGPSE